MTGEAEIKLWKNGSFILISKRLKKQPATLIGIVILILLITIAIFGPFFAPYSPTDQKMAERLQSPSREHLFGTDDFGRDIFSRIIYGTRHVIVVAGSITILAVIAGVVLGLNSGFRGGVFDEIVMRIMDIIMSFPALLLAMVVLFVLGTTTLNVILMVAIRYTPIITRVVRSVVLEVKTRQFIEAAKLRGESYTYILMKEIFPNVLPALAVEASMRFCYSIYLVASLAFLGMGAQPPTPDWGLMVGEARPWFHQAGWMLFFPAGAISLLVVGVGLFSDGLKQLFLPGGGRDA